MKCPLKSSTQWWLLLGILMLGLVLRGSLLSYGLPLLLYEDEPIYFNKMMAFGYGEFDPDYFKKPTFFLYFYFVFYYLYYLIGDFASWSAFERQFWQDPTTLALIGRSITLFFSVGSIGLVCLLGRRVFSPAVGFIAALLLALHTTHIQYTPIVIADIPALLFILLTAWLALEVYENGRWRDYLLCGVSIALVMSFKYNFFSAAFLVVAHTLRYFPQGWRNGDSVTKNLLSALKDKRLWLSLSLAGGLFVLLSPYVLLNFDKFNEHLTFEKSHMLQRTMELDRAFKPFISFPRLLFKIIPRDLSWPLYVFALLGLAVGLAWPWLPKRFRKGSEIGYAQILSLLSFPIIFLLVVSQFRLVNAKYVLPITPFLMIMAAFFAVWSIRRLIPSSKLAEGIAAALILLLSFPMWQDSFADVTHHQKMDTLAIAQRQLKQTLIPGQRLLIEKYTFPSWNMPILEAMFSDQRLLQMGQPETTAATVREFSPDYVLINPRPIKDPEGQKMLPFPKDYYGYLRKNYRVIRVISPYSQFSEKKLLSMPSAQTQDYLKMYLALEESGQEKNPGPTLFLLARRSTSVGRERRF